MRHTLTVYEERHTDDLLILTTSLCGNAYRPHFTGGLLRGVTDLPKITDLSGQAGAGTEVWLTPESGFFPPGM